MLETIRQALIEGRDIDMPALVQQALDSGLDARTILDDGLLAGMEVIGQRFREHEVFLPDVLLAARAMYAGLALLEPRFAEDGRPAHRGTIVMGTVEGDLHDIGKNLVCIMLRGAGFHVVDLGHGVAPAAFIEAVRENNAEVVGLSALLTTTMPGMARTIEALESAGLGDVRVLVGGAPVNEAFARDVGADAYGYDAAHAVELVSEWLT